MTNCTLFQKAGEYRSLVSSRLADAGDLVRVGYQTASQRIAALLNQYMLSELQILQLMLISFGVLLGATFSDFFKKYRKVVLVAFLVSVCLFVYKAFQLLGEWDEANSEF
ncbi:MAG TPA: hypothetical protein IAA32_00235 [Candidatus Butyricicoccus stercorigallinarum]|nr:hypothetical protein [Candidatus Butyricicoccus stercorigallinarum]